MTAVSGQISFVMSSYAASLPPPQDERGAKSSLKSGPHIVTFALQKRPRATRASVPKVRTGCTTCKKRHVKCDEAKPSCQRCVKWQGFCDGYDSQTPSTAASSPALTDSTSSPTPSKKRTPRVSSPLRRARPDTSSPTTICSAPSEHLFDDDLELRYFTTWYLARARTGGGLFDDGGMWEQTIPQLSHHHPSIRYAAMAVGAMSRSVRGGFMPRTAADMAADVDYGTDYGRALSFYGRAMGALRSAHHSDAGSLRAAVVCCLLFICFEALHGDSRAAFSHLDNAQMMLDEMLRRAGPSPFGSDVLERDMLNTFQRFMLQSWSCGVLRPRPRGRGAPVPWCCRRVDDMPATFDDLATARRWWEATQHHIVHSSDMAFRFTHLDLPEDLVAECAARVQKHLHRIGGLVPGDPPDPLPGPSNEDDDLGGHLSRWFTAFTPLWDACVQGSATSYDDFIRAAHLRIQYLSMYTCVSAPLSCDHGAIARMTPVFREIVQLSGLVLEHASSSSFPEEDDDDIPAEVFTMDASPSWPLFLTGMRCRDLVVREQAVRLLGRHPRRDGLWDSRMFHALATRNRAVEIWNAREGSREQQWWRLQARTAFVDSDGVLRARALTQNPASGAWEDGEHEVGVFMHMK